MGKNGERSVKMEKMAQKWGNGAKIGLYGQKKRK